jgi:cellulose synthase/poly-beta-1,6-N-acetylglucosamine synthase-like glycosyltransferase
MSLQEINQLKKYDFDTNGKQGYYNLVVVFIVLSLLIVLMGKSMFSDSKYLLLFIYGLLVTGTTLALFTITFTSYKDPYLTARKILANKHKQRQYFVSCIVAVKNEEKIISQCIQSMLNQDYKHKEIIIIDDASTDNTRNILKRYSDQGLIKAIYLEENVGKKKALAKGILNAKGNIYAFSDSDSVLALDAITKIVAIFKAYPDVGAVSGHCRVLNAEKNLLTLVQDTWYEGQFSIKKAFESCFGAVTCVSGPLAVFRKEAIFNFIPAWEYDSFLGQEFKFATDRTLTGFVLGSKDIGEKLKKKYPNTAFSIPDYPLHDWKIVYSKSAKVWTNVPETLRAMIRQQIRWKKSFIRNIFFTGTFYWKKPFPAAMYYYLHVLFVFIGPLIAIRHLIYLPLTGNPYSALLYLAGITYIGLMYGLAYKLENPDSDRWIYRPIMSLLSTLVFSFLVFFSLLTIKKNKWIRS